MLRNLVHNEHIRSLLSGTASVFGVKILSTLISLATQVALARLLGVAEYGRYIFCLAILMFLVFIARFGFEISGLKFIPHYVSQDNIAARRGYLHFSRGVVVLLSLLSILLLEVYAQFNAQGEQHDILVILLASALFVPVDALAQLATTELRGLRAVARANSYDAIVRPLVLLLAFLAVIFVTGDKPSAIMALQAYIIGSWFTLFVSTLSRNRLLAESAGESIETKAKYHVGEWLKVSAMLWLLNLFEVLLSLSDVYYVGWFCGTAEAGLFAAASRLALLLIFGMVAVNGTVAPLIAVALAKKDLAELKRLASLSSLVAFIFALPVAILFVPFGDVFLGLFGAEFREAYWACVILVCAQVCNCITAPAYYLLTLGHQQKRGALIFAAAFALNAILNIILTPRYGIEGAATASAISSVALNTGLYFAARISLGIKWYPWNIRALFARAA